ncbi:MAG: hypothetical protein HFJ52_03050 [Clostridia bacterium]|nr:hypothetical protein [Clostridia bacterium]
MKRVDNFLGRNKEIYKSLVLTLIFIDVTVTYIKVGQVGLGIMYGICALWFIVWVLELSLKWEEKK